MSSLIEHLPDTETCSHCSPVLFTEAESLASRHSRRLQNRNNPNATASPHSTTSADPPALSSAPASPDPDTDPSTLSVTSPGPQGEDSENLRSSPPPTEPSNLSALSELSALPVSAPLPPPASERNTPVDPASRDTPDNQTPNTPHERASPPVSLRSRQSSSDNSSIDVPIHQLPTKMPERVEALATHLILSRPPNLSARKITPNVLREFENHVENFFMNAKTTIPEDEKVTKILGCFGNPLVNDWISVNRSRLRTLTFPEFMKEFRSRWLPHAWVEDLRTEILSSSLGSNQTFEAWSESLRILNVPLRDSDSHIDEAQMRRQLEANIDPELRAMVRREKLSTIADFQEWLAAMINLDNERQLERKRIREVCKEQWQSNKRPYDPARSSYSNRSRSNANASSSTNSQSTTSESFPPKLTDDERKLLKENEGCFKCRVPFAGHRAGQCDIKLSGKDYKPLTMNDVLRAKANQNKTGSKNAPVASMTNHNSIEVPTSTPLAAIFPPISATDNSLSDFSENSLSSVSNVSPLKCEHLIWKCKANGNTADLSVNTTALIDSGAHMVFIRPDLVEKLELHTFRLTNPEIVSVAIDAQKPASLTHFARLTVMSRDNKFKSKVLNAVVTPGLCKPIILGLPFLCNNNISCDYAKRECNVTINSSPYNLLNTPPMTPFSKAGDTLAAIRERITTLSLQDELIKRETKVKLEFAAVFEPLPHVDELPLQPRARIRLKNPEHSIKSRNYPCPRKWKDAWHELLQQHLAAGRIRPSAAAAGSGAFIIPKADPTALPRWVNDYRQLNSNTITDSFPIPLVNDILTDCANGTYFATIDMTNSFFQTRMHDEDIELTAVNTPWGLYEWVVMPMGIKNAPSIHQRRVSAALRPWIGKICHVYIDDIAIWSKTLDEHEENVRTILRALQDNKLYCNPKKTKLFATEIRFLGHRVSAKGIEADEGKADRVKNWPRPTTAKQVRGFLGLVRYLAAFLPKIADHTTILDELTRKECDKRFPEWTTRHQAAFEAVKELATSPICLTTIDPSLMPEHKIFVTTDASDTGSGAILAFGPTYETARPVAYESRSFKGAELNYPVHEKELLAIVRALAKWRTDLLGYSFQVWTDHRTLEHFSTQRDMSRRQARWMEFLSQYDATIHYLPGDKNCAADALSRLPDGALTVIASTLTKSKARRITTRFELEDALLEEIKAGYSEDPFVDKLTCAAPGMENVKQENGFWFVDDRLIIPNRAGVREALFRLAHDNLGHFGSPKTYKALRDSFYWPKMRRDLEEGYIPGCADCQRNKARTTRPFGPLHPLPIPDARCDSVAIDFIGPLPKDGIFDTILTITDRLGSEIRILPTTSTLTAEQLAKLFFDSWYCENGLPLDIVSDRDKLFLSRFWKTLHKLTGVKLKMSSGYHPETDGASERTNKTVIQSIQYAVERDQKNWVEALPKIRFDIMNTMNSSTGLTPFQLRFGKSPRILPPLANANDTHEPIESTAREMLSRMTTLEMEAQDNLLNAKIAQASYANTRRNLTFPFAVGDRVMLSTLHRRREYKSSDSHRVAKFMPRYDGPYQIIATDQAHSTVTLDLPDNPHIFPVFHASEIRTFNPNDDELFPARALMPPDPVTIDGEKEFFIDKIVDQRRRGRGWQYLVRWRGEGPEGDKWLPGRDLEDCEALDEWERRRGVNAATSPEESSRSPSECTKCNFSSPPVAFPTGVLTHPC
jgi:hypothetical protein